MKYDKQHLNMENDKPTTHSQTALKSDKNDKRMNDDKHQRQASKQRQTITRTTHNDNNEAWQNQRQQTKTRQTMTGMTTTKKTTINHDKCQLRNKKRRQHMTTMTTHDKHEE